MVRGPLLRVAVSGPSMEPTLSDGEWWLARRTRRVHPGDLVVLEPPDFPGVLVVKRAVRREAGGWWVEGDNAAASRDSRVYGPVPEEAIVGTLLLRYRPLSARRSRPA